MTIGPGAMAKVALLVATLAILAPESLSHTLGTIADREGLVTVATRKQPHQARRHVIGNARRQFSSDRTADTAASNALNVSASSAPTSTSNILDKLSTAQQASQATNSTVSSKRRRLISSGTPVSSNSSSSSSTATPVSSGSPSPAAEDDPFSVFYTPAGQSWSSDSSTADSTSSSTSSAEDASSTDIFESGDGDGDGSMQQLYNTVTWTTTYFNSSDDTSTSITGTTSGAAQQQQQQSGQATTSSTAAMAQESGQYRNSPATRANNQTSPGSTTKSSTHLESAEVNLTTPDAQAMYDSTMAGVESPAGTTNYTNVSQDSPLPPTAGVQLTGDVLPAQEQYESLPQAANMTATGYNYSSNLEAYQADVSGDIGLQASTSGYDPSAGTSAGDRLSINEGIVPPLGGITVSNNATNPQPVTVSATDIAKESGGSSSSTDASVNSSSTRSSTWVFTDSLGNSLTFEESAPQKVSNLNLTPPVVDSNGMITHQVSTPPVVPVVSQQQQDTGEPSLQGPGSDNTAQAVNPASLKRPIKLGVGSDGSAGLRDGNPYDATTVGNGGAHLGPGLITGVGISLAGVFVVALGTTIWCRNKRKKVKENSVKKAKYSLKSFGTIPPKGAGVQHTVPVVVATAGNVSNTSYSPVGSPMRTSPSSVSAVGTQTVLVNLESEPAPGVNLRWFTCSSGSFDQLT